MSIDLTPLVQALAALACAALTGAAGYLAPLARHYLNIRLSATEADTIQKAADAGAKAAYGYLAANAASYRDISIRNAAIARGVQHVVTSAPDALRALGISPEHVRAMVEARFGGLLAADPNVSINAAAAPTPISAIRGPSA